MKVTPDLLKKYHDGRCSLEEKNAVHAWLNEDKIVTAEVPQMSDQKIADSNASIWNFLEQHIPPAAEKKQTLMGRLKSNWPAYAAACLLLVTIATITTVKNNVTPYQKENAVIHALTAPMGSTKTLVMPDGSKIYLHPGATLRYPDNFAKNSRNVELVGEAYFEISADKNRPFIIESICGTEIKVVGTAFNVKAEPKEGTVEVAVNEGTVHFLHTANRQKFLALTVGQSAKYNHSTNHFEEYKADTTAVGKWREGELVFHAENIQNIAQELELWYDVKINIKNKAILNKRYSAKYKNPTLNELIENMAFVLGYRYKIDQQNKTVTIY
ncbi:FecR family protein [Sphingobacterium sp. LRF_L2]|uniref:FecR family protein n=1 Tax=Sphingobacterium sp. LRF_L2 TaxID=3369421 RepID=UPI003F63D8BE